MWNHFQLLEKFQEDAGYAASGDVLNSTLAWPTNSSVTTQPTLYGCQFPTNASNWAITAVIATLLVLGVAGNVLTLCVILTNKCLRTKFNLFLVSLCASDLVSATICSPLWLYRRTWGFSQWQIGNGMCEFYWVVDFATDYVTSLHILCICLLRFDAVINPLTSISTRLGKNYFRALIASLWTVSFLVASPHAVFMEVRGDDGGNNVQWPDCSIATDEKEKYHKYTVIAYPLLFYLPATLIITLSAVMSFNLSKRTEEKLRSIVSDPARRRRIIVRNQKACTQLRLICFSFAVGYVPLAAYLIWTSASHLESGDCGSITFDYWFGVVSYITLRISECLNPVMYNLGCKEMRCASIKLVKSALSRKELSLKRNHQTPGCEMNPCYRQSALPVAERGRACG